MIADAGTTNSYSQSMIRDVLLKDSRFVKEVPYDVPLMENPSIHIREENRVKNKGDVELIFDKGSARTVHVYTQTLQDCVEEFVNSKNKVLLIFGESGSGKTVFSKMLASDPPKNLDEYLIVPISFSKLKDPYHNALREGLTRYQMDIKTLSTDRKIVWLFDDCEIVKEGKNLFLTNHLEDWGNAKTIFFLNKKHWKKKEFYPCFSPLGEQYNMLTTKELNLERINELTIKKVYIEMLAPLQIQDYLNKFLEQNKLPPWNLQDYLNVIEKIPEISDRISNPRFLKIFAISMPFIKEEFWDIHGFLKYISQTYLCWQCQRASDLLKRIPEAPDVTPQDVFKFALEVVIAMHDYNKQYRFNEYDKKEFFGKFFESTYDFIRQALLEEKGGRWGFEDDNTFYHLVYLNIKNFKNCETIRMNNLLERQIYSLT
jgi:hypothetical protein